MAVVGVAVILHLVGLVIRVARVVHHHDEGAVELPANGGLVEALGGIGLSLAHLPAVLVAEGVAELLDRLAQGEAEHVIDGAEHLGLAGGNLPGVLAGGGHTAQLQPVLAQFARHEAAHPARVLARIGLGHHVHGHEPVLLGQIGNTTEGSAVAKRTLEEELHPSILDGLSGKVDDTLQHEVGLLQLVVEKQVVLRELHRQGVGMGLGEVGAQHVHAAEHPATARAFLVVDALRGSLHAEVGVHGPHVGAVLHQVVDAVVGDGVEERLVGRPGLLHFLYLREHLRGDASLSSLSHRSCRNSQQGSQKDDVFSHYVIVISLSGCKYTKKMWKNRNKSAKNGTY